MKPTELTRQNSLIYQQPNEWRDKVFLPRAIGWGSQTPVSFMELLKIWFSEKRNIDVSIMLSNVINESGRCPYIARYELGQHIDNFGFCGGIYYRKPEFEFECTSFGLFQPMGFHLINKYVNKKSANAFAEFTIDKQFDCFVDLMQKCFVWARAQRDYDTVEEIVKGAFAGYAGNVRMIDWFAIKKKYATWQKLEAKDRKFMASVGFTPEEMDYLIANDKF